MTEIVVLAAGRTSKRNQVVWRERVSTEDLDSGHFADQLIERLGWALSDADSLAQRPASQAPSQRRPRVRQRQRQAASYPRAAAH